MGEGDISLQFRFRAWPRRIFEHPPIKLTLVADEMQINSVAEVLS